MGSALVWAAIPHNSDGVVFQVRVIRGLQRFHISRQTLEETFDLAPHASDAGQLELFYQHKTLILRQAMRKRPIAGADTAALQTADFGTVVEAGRDATAHMLETLGSLAPKRRAAVQQLEARATYRTRDLLQPQGQEFATPPASDES
jgi:hypothetical protein